MTDQQKTNQIESFVLATAQRSLTPIKLDEKPLMGEFLHRSGQQADLTYGCTVGRWASTGPLSKTQPTFAVCLASDSNLIMGQTIKPGCIVVFPAGFTQLSSFSGRMEYTLLSLPHCNPSEAINHAIGDFPNGFHDHFRIVTPPGDAGKKLLEVTTELAADLSHQPRPECKTKAAAPTHDLGAAQLAAIHQALQHCDLSVNPLLTWDSDRCRIVLQAMQYLPMGIENHAFSIDVLVDHIQVSRRTMFRAFHMVLGMSPSRFLKLYRFTRARLDLLAAEHGHDKVIDIAYRWGFWEAGRFALEYRELFGERPSDTLAATPK